MKYIVGVDFGHGETSAWIVPVLEDCNDRNSHSLRIRNGAHANDKVCPSWVYLKNGKYSLTATVGSIIRYGFKARPKELDKEQEQKEAFAAYVRLIVQALLNYNDELEIENGVANFLLCIACPTRWSEADRKDYLIFLSQAMQGLGIVPKWVINESDAAFFSWGNKSDCTLVIDYGSSTIDYTVMLNRKKVSEDKWSNSQLGASSVEKGIVDDYKENNYESYQRIISATIQECDRTGNPQYDSEEIRSFLITDTRIAKENVFKNATWPNMSRMTFSMFDNCGGYYSGYDDSSFGQIAVGGPMLKMQSFIMYKEAVEQDFKELKNKIDNKIGKNILRRIILSGGACLMTWVRTSVQQIFGQDIEIVMDNEPAYVVSKGIALYAKAQLEALLKLQEAVSQIDYMDMYRNADRDATVATLKNLSYKVKHAVDLLPEPNAYEINDEFRKFLYNHLGMNGPNTSEYSELFFAKINQILNINVHNKLLEIVITYFGKDDIGNTEVTFNPTFTYYNKEVFEEGHHVYNKIADWIKQTAIDEHMAYVDNSFRINEFKPYKRRSGPEKDKLVEGTLSKMISYFKDEEEAIRYNKGVLEGISSGLKNQVLEISIRLFYEQQLFRTTFVK